MPVSSLTLEQTFEPELSELQVGESFVRTLTMVADGLDGAVLPPFSPEEIEGANLYPDPADIDRTFVEGRIIGTRTEQTTVVATDAGTIEIPELTVLWWNVETDQQEASVIPATRIEVSSVAGAVPSEQAVASQGNIEELLETVPVVDQDMIDAQAQAEFIEVDSIWLDAFIAAAFVVVLLSIYRLVLQPNQAAITAYLQAQRKRIADHYDPSNNETVAFRQLRVACSGKDMNAVRETLITWSDHFLQSRQVNSMEDILQQNEAPELHDFVSAIQQQLFNDASEQSFDPGSLLGCVSTLRKQRSQQRKAQAHLDRYALPPLYKT